MARMAELQQLNPDAQYAADESFDWTDEEKKGRAGLNVTTFEQRLRDVEVTFSDSSVRKAFAAGDLDWVAKGAVTTPTSQGRCATCQDYSAAVSPMSPT